jgi:D-aspartate ligase
MDMDHLLDKQDGQYKLLDFNPRIGAQFRLFVDDGPDVARALYRDLAGQTVRRSRQVDARVFVVDSDDLRASVTTLGEANCRLMPGWIPSKAARSLPGSVGMIRCPS